MQSLKSLYKIGKGPSSSHTIGPQIIAEYVEKNYGKGEFVVELFGSLALTGKGHGTDSVIKSVLGENTKIIFNTTEKDLDHPNTLKVFLDGKEIVKALSVGGGSVIINGKKLEDAYEIYPQKNFQEIMNFCLQKRFSLVDYVRYYESEVFEHLKVVWQVMKESVERGLNTSGVLNGGLNLHRKAKELFLENRENCYREIQERI